MTVTIPTIVEGQGEIIALPILLRRLGELYFPSVYLKIPPPHRLPRGKMLKRPLEFKRAIQLAAAKGGSSSGAFILVLLDSDDDCPVEIGEQLLAEANEARSDFQTTISLAVREFESWIIASAATLDGILSLPENFETPSDLEEIRDAKGWIKKHRTGGTYSETIDQPKLTSKIDIETARINSKSFDRFCRNFQKLVGEFTL